MRKKCVIIVGENEGIAKAIGAGTLPHLTGDFIADVQAAVEAIQQCGRASIIIRGGTPYEVVVAAAAAFIEYRRSEVIVLHNPSAKRIEAAAIHALGTGETYHLRKAIMDLIRNRCTPIETIADILGHTPKTIERHARLMKSARVVTIVDGEVCMNP